MKRNNHLRNCLFFFSLYRQLSFVTFTEQHLRDDKTFQLKGKI